MRLITAYTHILTPQKAIDQLQEELEKEGIASLICYYSEEHAGHEIQHALTQAFPSTPFIGCSSCCGVMTDQGYHAGPVIALMAIYDSFYSAYGTGLINFTLGCDHKKNTQIALQQALVSADRVGEVPSLVVLHSTPGNEELLIDAIDETFGTQVPMIGGSSADNDIQEKWSIITQDGWSQNGIAIQLFFPSQPLLTGLSAGYSPTEFEGRVTKSAGRLIEQIDGERAADIYTEWVSDHSGMQINDDYLFQHVTRFPLGRVAGYVHQQPYYKLSHPIRMTKNGALEQFSTIKEGERITLMTGSKEQLINRASKVIKEVNTQNYHESLMLGAIIIYCAGSMLRLGSEISTVYQQLSKQMRGHPFICPFTFGEQGRFTGGENAHGNLMIASVIFYESE
ncbi:FIST signal transduction protein [Vibrio sp.]|uniref:FIST signal transduction protein n=1 Tax=Vibrio sp. TaxID=678 RepID=UPI003D0D1A99